jgi:hypothetical protein
LYLHSPSGEYRILYWNYGTSAYYILMVPQGGSPRCIGVPSDTPGIDKVILDWNIMTTTNSVPPVVFRNYLHWDTSSDAGILVFDTVLESFRLMRRPAAATGLCTRLCDMEGSIGFSCFGDGKRVAKIWVLEDYEREVWSFKYQVQIPVWSIVPPMVTCATLTTPARCCRHFGGIHGVLGLGSNKALSSMTSP